MKYLVSVILGIAFGFPQGIQPFAEFIKGGLIPTSTIYVLVFFGLFAGVLMGIQLIRVRWRSTIGMTKVIVRYLDPYLLFTAFALSVGIPGFYVFGIGNLSTNDIFHSWFFSSFGLGMIIGGATMSILRRNVTSRCNGQN